MEVNNKTHKKFFRACLIVACALVLGLTGCSYGNKLSESSTDKQASSEVQASTDEQSSTEESKIWQQKEDGYDHLYAINSGIIDENYSYDWFKEMDGNILVHYSYYTAPEGEEFLDGESRESFLMLLDPLEDKVLKQSSLGDTYYFEQDVSIKEDGKIYAIDSCTNCINVYDSDLNFLKSYEPKEDTQSLCINHEVTKVYYYDTLQEKFFEQDLQTEEERQILAEFQDVDSAIDILDVWNDQYLCIRYWDDTGHSVHRALDIETGEERKLYKSEFQNIKSMGELALFEDWGIENAVIGIQEDYDAKIKVLISNTGHEDRFVLDCENMLAIGTWSENVKEQGIATVDLYDLKTGVTKNHLEYHFIGNQDDVCCSVDCVYLKKYDAVAVMMNGTHIKKMYLWDVANDRVAESYSELLELDTLSTKLKNRMQEISEKYDVTIHVNDAFPQESQDAYRIEGCDDELANYLALIIIDKDLSHYPDGMFSQLRQGKPDGFHIYLADSIVRAEDYGWDAVDTAAGLENSAENQYYVILDVTDQGGISNNIYHEIMHVFTDYLDITDYSLYEDWDAYNPEGFEYDYSYETYASDMEGLYLYQCEQDADDVYFLDSYSKSYPTEDFSRIMEYAMSSDLSYRNIIAENPHLNAKRQRISERIREAFDDSTWPEVTCWEN